MQVKNNVDVGSLTTYGVPGMAQYFVECKNSDELVEALNFAYEQDLPYFILGSGSNVLFAGEYPGIVIRNTSNKYGESGQSLPVLAYDLAQRNIAGSEVLAGIPGTLGGAVRGNAGTREGEIASLIKNVIVWKEGKIEKVKNKKCEFSYRESRFKNSNEVILAVELEEKKAKYNVLEKYMEGLEKRKAQPKGKSCGSFFQNPEGDSAGRLIEACGLKGKIIGGAQISPEHANWIINTGKATSEDILKLARLAMCEVEKKFGIVLVPEVEIV